MPTNNATRWSRMQRQRQVGRSPRRRRRCMRPAGLLLLVLPAYPPTFRQRTKLGCISLGMEAVTAPSASQQATSVSGSSSVSSGTSVCTTGEPKGERENADVEGGRQQGRQAGWRTAMQRLGDNAARVQECDARPP